MRSVKAGLVVFLLINSIALAHLVHAAIVWDYETTDGNTTISGQLTTDGNPGDELIFPPKLYLH